MSRSCFGSFAAITLALIFVGLFYPMDLNAQSSELQLSGGLGYSFPDSGGEPYGVGAGLVLEYLPAGTSWISPRVYGGIVLSGTRETSCSLSPCAVSSQIGVAGGKVRLTIPIPVLSPFLELGAGLSAGAITTQYSEIQASGVPSVVDEDHAGVMVHIPVTIGASFGTHRQHDVSFEYYVHPGRDHVAGMFAVGVGFGAR